VLICLAYLKGIKPNLNLVLVGEGLDLLQYHQVLTAMLVPFGMKLSGIIGTIQVPIKTLLLETLVHE